LVLRIVVRILQSIILELPDCWRLRIVAEFPHNALGALGALDVKEDNVLVMSLNACSIIMDAAAVLGWVGW
jgi:hypothetical protein